MKKYRFWGRKKLIEELEVAEITIKHLQGNGENNGDEPNRNEYLMSKARLIEKLRTAERKVKRLEQTEKDNETVENTQAGMIDRLVKENKRLKYELERYRLGINKLDEAEQNFVCVGVEDAEGEVA